MLQSGTRHSGPDSFGAQQQFHPAMFHWNIENPEPSVFQPWDPQEGDHNHNAPLPTCRTSLMSDSRCEPFLPAVQREKGVAPSLQGRWKGRKSDGVHLSPCCTGTVEPEGLVDSVIGDASPQAQGKVGKNGNLLQRAGSPQGLTNFDFLQEEALKMGWQGTGVTNLPVSYGDGAPSELAVDKNCTMSPDVDINMNHTSSLSLSRRKVSPDNGADTNPKSSSPMKDVNGNSRKTESESLAPLESDRAEETEGEDPSRGRAHLLTTRPGAHRAENTSTRTVETLGARESNRLLCTAEKLHAPKDVDEKSTLLRPAFPPHPPLRQADEDLVSPSVSDPSRSVTATDNVDDAMMTSAAFSAGGHLILENIQTPSTHGQHCRQLLSSHTATADDELLNIMTTKPDSTKPRTNLSQHVDPPDFHTDPISRPASPLTIQDEEEEQDSAAVDSAGEDSSSFCEETNSDDSGTLCTTRFKPIASSAVQNSTMETVLKDPDPQILWSVSHEASAMASRSSSPMTIQDEIGCTMPNDLQDLYLLHTENSPLSYTQPTRPPSPLTIKDACCVDDKPEQPNPKSNNHGARTTQSPSTKEQTTQTVPRQKSKKDDNAPEPKTNHTAGKVSESAASLSLSLRKEYVFPAGRHREVFLKTVIVGDFGVGKSQLLHALSQAPSSGKPGFVCTAYRPREFAEMTLSTGGRRTRVKIMDTAGQERYRSLSSSYFRDVQGCFLVFNTHQKDSFDNVMQWYVDMQKYDVIPSSLLIGVTTPSQSRDAREVTSERAFKLADSLQTQYLETTLKDQEMLLWILERMVEEVRRHVPEGPGSSSMTSIVPAVTGGSGADGGPGKRRRREFVFCASS